MIQGIINMHKAAHCSFLLHFCPLYNCLKGGSTTNKTRAQKLRIDMINIPSKYFFKIMLGFPAATVAAKSSLAQKQTLVAKKRTLESK